MKEQILILENQKAIMACLINLMDNPVFMNMLMDQVKVTSEAVYKLKQD